MTSTPIRTTPDFLTNQHSLCNMTIIQVRGPGGCDCLRLTSAATKDISFKLKRSKVHSDHTQKKKKRKQKNAKPLRIRPWARRRRETQYLSPMTSTPIRTTPDFLTNQHSLCNMTIIQVRGPGGCDCLRLTSAATKDISFKLKRSKVHSNHTHTQKNQKKADERQTAPDTVYMIRYQE